MFWPGLLIALGLLFAFAWILVRHIGLAAAVALSPWRASTTAVRCTASALWGADDAPQCH